MSALRSISLPALLALSIAVVIPGCGDAHAGAAGAPPAPPAPASAPAAEHASAHARVCASRADASGVPPQRTSKARHVPDESDPCADSTGAVPAPHH